MKENAILLTYLCLCTPYGLQENAYLLIRHNKIHAFGSMDSLSLSDFSSFEIEMKEFDENVYLVPGFIDMHVHGANGSDVMDANLDALENISLTLAKEGTTGFLATTMTAEPALIERALYTVRDFMNKPASGATLLGVHLEGPFLSTKKMGAQCGDSILSPNIDYLSRWQSISNHAIKVVTLAPELKGSIELIRYLFEHQIIASIGHTDASFAETQAAIQAGCTHATHVFNAMRGIHQREPGAVGAVLLSDQIIAELIVDGVHLHPRVVELILRLKGPEKMVLVTDAMRAKCLPDGIYDLGGQAIQVKNNIAKLENGTLAGSVLKMNSALKNMLTFTRCSLTDAIKMTSENPAKALGLFSKTGSIELNKNADLVVLDKAFNVVMTIVGGRII